MRNTSRLALLVVSLCFPYAAMAGTFQVLEAQVTVSGGTTADLEQKSGDQIDSQTGQGFVSNWSFLGLASGSKISQGLYEFQFKWKIEFIPQYRGETPGSNPYQVEVAVRHQSIAWVWLRSDEPTMWAQATTYGGHFPYRHVYLEDHQIAYEEDGLMDDPASVWEYESNPMLPEVTFSLQPDGRWIGWATVIDLTPAFNFQQQHNCNPMLMHESEVAGAVKKQMRVVEVGGQQFPGW